MNWCGVSGKIGFSNRFDAAIDRHDLEFDPPEKENFVM